MNNRPQWVLLPLGVILLALSVYLCFYDWYAGAAGLIVSIIALFVCWRIVVTTMRRQQELMDRVFQDNDTVASELVENAGVPSLLFDDTGRILWRNRAFAELSEKENICDILPQFRPKEEHSSFIFGFGTQSYQIRSFTVERAQMGRVTYQYWVERTEAEHYRHIYEAHMPYVALVYVDNYEELLLDSQFLNNSVLAEVETLVASLARETEGLYRRYENGRFLLVFEAAHLTALEEKKFDILDRAHEINTGTEQVVTLSIAVGAAARLTQADEAARQAMEFALGRGGDQAVVKNGTNYTFYGGKQQAQTQQSKIRIRLFAKAFRQLLENSGSLFIVGHRQPDMDCLGAALGLLACARAVGCRTFLVLDGNSPMIDLALSQMEELPAYANLIVTPERAQDLLRPSSVVAVVDTQRRSSCLAPELVAAASKLVLIDHHRRSADYIDNATLNYLDARASSTCEIVTEILQYFHENIRPSVFECNALLAGITIDTKQFAYNASARTFEAAGYLKRAGASTALVKQLFKDDLETYANRVDVVKNATLLEGGIAISTCPQEMANAELIAAQAADELIMIRGVEAAFVLAYAKDGSYINVSGRSLGNINVQVILERLGGGGQLTMAAAQLRFMNMEQAVATLTDSIAQM